METLDLSSEGVRLVRATKRHARELARVMRAKDMDEIRATGGFVPEPAVRVSINRSVEAYAAYVGDDLVCVFGVNILNEMAQAPWMLSSVHVEKHAMTFWRCSKIVVSYFREKYPLMMNMIHGNYTEALRWVERLGFTLSPPEEFGVRGDLFCRATMATQKVVLHV